MVITIVTFRRIVFKEIFMEEEKLEDIDFTREKAKEYIKSGDMIKAEVILQDLWESSSKGDVYLLYDYGYALRNNRKSDKFIDICWIVNPFLDNFYKDTFLYSIGVK